MKTAKWNLIATVLVLTWAVPVQASLDQFAGNWRNSDANTRGVTRLEVRVSGTNVTVQAWGKCHPEDCDWGTVSAQAYGPNISANLASTVESLSANFDSGFSQTMLILEATGSGQLRAEVLTRFTDSSGRSNYRNVYTFERSSMPAGAIRKITPAVRAVGMPAPLPPPVQLGPANGTSFDRYPRTTTLTWRPLEGAASYTVEIDCYGCCQSGRWCTDVGKEWKVETGITSTRYVFDFVGAQPGRWRVWAMRANGQPGNKSDWWEFRYTK